ncbi:MAG: hypothetical protein HY909_13895 [Deltaproteobacteria bacterium]|nr:hypothetical protein [Deltaproteobacteria bacterium]
MDRRSLLLLGCLALGVGCRRAAPASSTPGAQTPPTARPVSAAPPGKLAPLTACLRGTLGAGAFVPGVYATEARASLSALLTMEHTTTDSATGRATLLLAPDGGATFTLEAPPAAHLRTPLRAGSLAPPGSRPGAPGALAVPISGHLAADRGLAAASMTDAYAVPRRTCRAGIAVARFVRAFTQG